LRAQRKSSTSKDGIGKGRGAFFFVENLQKKEKKKGPGSKGSSQRTYGRGTIEAVAKKKEQSLFTLWRRLRRVGKIPAPAKNVLGSGEKAAKKGSEKRKRG